MKRDYRLKFTGYIFLLFVLLSTVHCNLYPIYAADSTPSADIKSKLEELKKQIASKAAQIKQEISRKLKDKAYIGIIKSKSDASITLATNLGPKIVSINVDTVFESQIKQKTKLTLKDLSSEDYIAALGDTDETGILTAKKIVFLQTSKTEPKTHTWGQVISVSDKLVTLKGKNSSNFAATLPISSRVKVNDFVILTGTKDKNEIFNAKFVYVIPTNTTIKQIKGVTKQNASPSAKTASPSANIKSTSR